MKLLILTAMIDLMQAEYRVTRMQKATKRKSNGVTWLRKLKEEKKKNNRDYNSRNSSGVIFSAVSTN